MNAERAGDIRNLRGLKNISWLSSRQLNQARKAVKLGKVRRLVTQRKAVGE